MNLRQQVLQARNPQTWYFFCSMMKCDEEGATQNMMGAAVLVCTDGQWVYDSTATAAANKCDEEGATKTESMGMGDAFSMDMTYICKDGQWEMQMPDFGGGNFGGAGQIPEETPGLK